jgi:hypothetical protein
MKPTTSPQCALAVSTTVPSRAAEVRLCKRVACSLQLAVLRQGRQGGLLEQGRRANAVAWMGGDAPLFQVVRSGHGCLSVGTLCDSHRGCEMCDKPLA